MKQFNFSCKYCSFVCSGENVDVLENHLKECMNIPVKCYNQQCPFSAERRLIKDHFAECLYTIDECPNTECKIKLQRKKMSSHLLECQYRRVSCEQNGCYEILPYMDLRKHLIKCHFYSQYCVICNEPLKEQPRHTCTIESVECSHGNSDCIINESIRGECFLNSKMGHNKHPVFMCKFCEYKSERRNDVLHHMIDKCKHKTRRCPDCDKMVLMEEWIVHVMSSCSTQIYCRGCQLYIDK